LLEIQEGNMTTASGHTTSICASKVIGTNVKDTSGKKIGTVEDIVLDKQANRIMFAVVGFGGFLGMGEKYHPIPWSSLDYQPADDGYVVKFTKEQLEAAPADSIDALTRDGGVAYRDRSYKYYNTARDW
jgi:sporulation protein YlmC with PRC-barrel domain